MNRLLLVCLIAAVAMLPSLASSAEPGNMYGQSAKFHVSISSDDLTDPSAMLSVSEIVPDEISPQYGKQIVSVPFLSECSVKNDKIICRRNGKTVMAGATYRQTLDATPQCPGHAAEYRYTCVKGCTVNTPKYLATNGYEPCS